MSQQDIDFGRDHRVSEAQRDLMRVVNDAVDAVGLMIAAGACGCRTQDLSDALTGRSNRYMRIEWVLAIRDVAPLDFKQRIVQASATSSRSNRFANSSPRSDWRSSRHASRRGSGRRGWNSWRRTSDDA